jgi:hypothetical protein
MQPAKVNVLIAQFAYGGNGGVPMTLPSHVSWFAKVYAEMKADERIGQIALHTLSDTPITMTRNRAVQTAVVGDYDMILMIDSDNQPDCELKTDPSAKPFWQTSFDFAYERLMRGVPTVVCAPYCGPPPHENVYVFQWEMHENSPLSSFSLEPFSRQVASTMTGIRAVAAGPTGVTLYTTNAFELMKPPYFYYEYKDEPYQTEKASTEDVTNFRDINLLGTEKFGEPIVYCNWDAWAAHTKVKNVRKPWTAKSDDVNDRFRTAILENLDHSDRVIDLDFEARAKRLPKTVAVEEERIPAVPDVRPLLETRDSDPVKGVAIRKRQVCGHVVTSVGHQTPTPALERLRDIVEWVSQVRPDKALRCIEVGSWVGESAVAIASGFRHGGTVYCVESFEGDASSDPINRAVATLGKDAIRDYFVQNTAGLPIVLKEGLSQDVAASIDRAQADLVFVDASHEYEAAKADIETWINHVAPDGYLIGDDLSPVYPGVQRAVKELFEDREIPFIQVDGTDLWMVAKAEYDQWLARQK